MRDEGSSSGCCEASACSATSSEQPAKKGSLTKSSYASMPSAHTSIGGWARSGLPLGSLSGASSCFRSSRLRAEEPAPARLAA